MKRIIMHWTAGTYEVNSVDVQHYHYIIGGDGYVVLGLFKPEDNTGKLVTGKYAAHTANCNTDSIGISVACMQGAKESGDYGKYPLTEKQVDQLVYNVAELCLQYNIPCTPRTVLSHAEVQPTLGITQKGKWDIAVLPFKPEIRGAIPVGNYLRTRVQDLLDNYARYGKKEVSTT